MAKKMLFLFNPQAGKAAIREHLLDIITCFSNAGYDISICATQYAGHLPELIRQKAGDFDLLVTSGGDGTLNETVNGLLHSGLSLPVGYIPAGTINDFATTLKISKNMVQASKDIVNGSVFPCDVGRFQKKYFTYVAAFGAFTDVSYQTPQSSKNLLGKAAYVLEAIGRLPTLKSYRMRFSYDNTVIEDEFLFGMVSNSITVGGMPLNRYRTVSMHDGLLEVLLVRKPSLPFDVEAAISSLQTLDTNSPFLYSFKVRELHVTALTEEPLPWTIDGEYGGNDRELDIGVVPAALNILIPSDTAAASAESDGMKK